MFEDQHNLQYTVEDGGRGDGVDGVNDSSNYSETATQYSFQELVRDAQIQNLTDELRRKQCLVKTVQIPKAQNRTDGASAFPGRAALLDLQEPSKYTGNHIYLETLI